MDKHSWHPLEHHPDVIVGHYYVPSFVSNSVAIRADQGHWIIISPGAPLLQEFKESWFRKGDTISLIMPNSYHYMGVDAWLAEFPSAQLYASEKAIPRLNRKGINRIQPLEKMALRLPSHYQLLFPPGHRGGDVWLSKADEVNGTLWITCDSFLNYPRLSKHGSARAMQVLLGSAPGLKISQVNKWFILDNRKKFKHWLLKQLDAFQPMTLIPSHGEIEQDSHLTERLCTLARSRL